MLNLIDNVVIMAVLAVIGLVIIMIAMTIDKYNSIKLQKASDIISIAKEIAVNNRSR